MSFAQADQFDEIYGAGASARYLPAKATILLILPPHLCWHPSRASACLTVVDSGDDRFKKKGKKSSKKPARREEEEEEEEEVDLDSDVFLIVA